MGRINNMEALLREKQRLQYECTLKEDRLKNRLERAPEAWPQLLSLLLPKGKNIPAMLGMAAGLLWKGIRTVEGETLLNGAPDSALITGIIALIKKVFSRKEKKEEPEK